MIKKALYSIVALAYVGIGVWGYQQIPVDLHYYHYLWPLIVGIMFFSLNGAGTNPFKFASSIFSVIAVLIIPSVSLINGIVDKSQTFGWMYFISTMYATATVSYIGIVMSPFTYFVNIRNHTKYYNETKDSFMEEFKRRHRIKSFDSRYYKQYIEDVNDYFFDISSSTIYTNIITWPIDIIKVLVVDNLDGILTLIGMIRNVVCFPSDFIKKKVRGF